jgi:hypothetical protein
MQALWIAYGSVALLLAVPCDAFIGAGLAQTQGFNPRAASPVILQAGGKFNKDPNAASRIAELLASFQKKQRQYSEHPNKFMEDAMDAIKRHDPTMALESFDRAMAIDNAVSKCLWGRGRKYCGCDVVIVVRGVVVVMVMWSYNLIEDFVLIAHHTRVSCLFLIKAASVHTADAGLASWRNAVLRWTLRRGRDAPATNRVAIRGKDGDTCD